MRKISQALLELLTTPGLEIVAHNAKFEMEWFTVVLKDDSILWLPTWVCTQVQAWMIDNRKGSQGLNDQCLLYFGFQLKSLSKVNRENLDNQNRLATTTLLDVLKYNGLDAKYTLSLYYAQQYDLSELLGLVAPTLERQRCLPTLVAAQIKGFPVNQTTVQSYRVSFESNRKSIIDGIQALPEIEQYRRRFGEFSPTSPDHQAKMLEYVFKRTEGKQKSGRYSTDASALEQMTDIPFAGAVLKLRGLDKMISTYIAPLDIRSPDTVVFPDGCVHTTFNSTFTDTGRLSSDSPNMQNFPKRKNPEMRAMLVAPPGFALVAADYGQIEARVIGCAADDRFLIKSLWEEWDIHMYWAERIAKLDPPTLARYGTLAALRSDIKNVMVFPAFYGASMYSIATYLRLKESVVRPIFAEFWEMHKDVKVWQDRVRRSFDTHGYVETLTGRRRYGPMPYNAVINSPIQGSASDIVVMRCSG